jgi:hypothetical protein
MAKPVRTTPTIDTSGHAGVRTISKSIAQTAIRMLD